MTLENKEGFITEFKKRKIISKTWLFRESRNLWSNLAEENITIDTINNNFAEHKEKIPRYKRIKNISYLK